jgi:hypothetical protein
MFKLLFILPCFSLMFQPLNAKVESPNYNFELSNLDEFYPGKLASEIEKKFGKGEAMGKEGELSTKKFLVKHPRYLISAVVQEKGGEVQDVFFRLPSYFLHDGFFQSLINRLGKQSTYQRVGEEAYYTWTKDSLKHIYSAACTITCFPIFYAIEKSDSNSGLLKKLKKSTWP